MRDYGKVHSSVWTSKTIRALSDDGKILAFYLMTSQHTTIAGVFRLPDGYASDDLVWPSERVSKGFDELLRNGFANRCETTKWVWISKHLDWNPPENPNQCKAAAKVVALIPDDCCWKQDFLEVFGERLGIEVKPSRKGSKRVLKPEAVTGTVTGEETGSEASADAFVDFWAAYPRKTAKSDAEKAWKKIEHTSELDSRIIAAVTRASKSAEWTKDAGQFIPYPATWLNKRRWEDEASHGAGKSVPEVAAAPSADDILRAQGLAA